MEKFRMNWSTGVTLLLSVSVCSARFPWPMQEPEKVRECGWLYKGHPTDCRSYYQCLHGFPVLKRCPSKLVWNAKDQGCDWEYRTGCSTGKEGLSSFTAISWKPHVVAKKSKNKGGKPKDKCSGTGLSPHETDCTMYYHCTSSGAVLSKCPPPLYFDPALLVCNWPSQVDCVSSASKPPAAPPNAAPQEVTTTPAPTTTTTTSTTTTTPVTTERPTTPTTSLTTTVTTAPPITFITRPTTTTTTTPTTTTTTTTTTTRRPTAPPVETVTVTTSNKKIVCYFSNWAVYRRNGGKFGPKDVDPSLCTHVIYAFAWMNPTTYELEMFDRWVDSAEGLNFYKEITELRSVGIKVLIAIGGWEDSIDRKWSLLFKDPSKMQTFINSVKAFLTTHNFDGIDVDIEYPVCGQGNCNHDSLHEKQAFSTLLKGLRQFCGPETILSVALSANPIIMKEAYELPVINKYVDFINVMSYDYHGPWERVTGVNAPLDAHPQEENQYLDVMNTVEVLLQHVSPEKIIVGMPTYGHSFQLSNEMENWIGAKTVGAGDAGPATGAKGMLAYYEICQKIWEHVDSNAQYAVMGNQWVSYDDPQMIEKKCDYIKSNGLGGAMIWALDLDDFNNVCKLGRYPLLTTINRSLRGPLSGTTRGAIETTIHRTTGSSNRKRKSRRKSSRTIATTTRRVQNNNL